MIRNEVAAFIAGVAAQWHISFGGVGKCDSPVVQEGLGFVMAKRSQVRCPGPARASPRAFVVGDNLHAL